MAEKKAVFVIYSCDKPSRNPADWQIVPHDKLPPWVIDPNVLGQLASGMMCFRPDIGEKGSPFYRADVGLDQQEKERLERALKHVERVEARKLLELPADRPLIDHHPHVEDEPIITRH